MKLDSKISSVETLRGIAALMVVFYHLSNGNINFFNDGFWLKEAGSYGYNGIIVFFVISGFIIPWSLHKNQYHIRSFFRFLFRRSVRIEIPYIASIVLVVALTLLASRTSIFMGAEYHPDPYQILANVVYLPGFWGYNWLQPIYWTLLAEVQFYILIGVLFELLKGRYKWAILLLLMASYQLPFMLFPFIGLFLMGIVYFQYRSAIIPKNQALLAGFVVFVFSSYSIGFLETLIGGGAILFIAFASTTNYLTSFFGRISYSLYLTHIVIGGKIINLGIRYSDTIFLKLVVFIFAFAASILFAWIFYKVIERPAINLSKQIEYSAGE